MQGIGEGTRNGRRTTGRWWRASGGGRVKFTGAAFVAVAACRAEL